MEELCIVCERPCSHKPYAFGLWFCGEHAQALDAAQYEDGPLRNATIDAMDADREWLDYASRFEGDGVSQAAHDARGRLRREIIAWAARVRGA